MLPTYLDLFTYQPIYLVKSSLLHYYLFKLPYLRNNFQNITICAP